MNHFLCFLAFIFAHFSIGSHVEAKMSGFSTELIHRDSKLSPFYNPSSTPSDLARNGALRSIARANGRFHPSNSIQNPNNIEPIVIPDPLTSSYLMKLSVGTPPVEIFAVADTGSDLIWFQCKPCTHCYPQILPILNPSKSSTYNKLSCHSKPCQALQPNTCANATDESCPYSLNYSDGSYTNGILATDTFTFDSTGRGRVTSFPNFIFGCGFDNGGTFDNRDAGIVGLAAGTHSLVSQLGSQIDKKFSYCLLPTTANSTSKLKFGNDAVLSGQPGIVSTPLILRTIRARHSTTFYYLTLEAVSVGGKRIEYTTMETPNKQGNIIIDSGTTLNMLDTELYNDVVTAIKEAIHIKPVEDPSGTFHLCYDKKSFRKVSEHLKMVFHFTGADVVLKTLNTFLQLDSVSCLSMLPYRGINIYGNVAQVNFQVEFDLTRKLVYFAPADCSTQAHH